MSTQQAPPQDPPREPSVEEQNWYYYGLPSKPKLIARSPALPWTERVVTVTDWTTRVRKCLQNVGRHDIISLWNDHDGPGSLKHKLLSELDMPWNAVDILRIGYEDQPDDSPVTIFVSVEAGSTSWSQGYDAMERCRRVLADYGIVDVACEMKESRVWPLGDSIPAPTPTFTPTSASAFKISSQYDTEQDPRMFRSAKLGTSIAAYSNPGTEGTKCLYLSVGKEIVALTCRHVAFPGCNNHTGEYRHKDSAPKRDMVQPGDGTITRLIERWEGISSDAEKDIQIIQGKRENAEVMYDPITEKDRREQKLSQYDEALKCPQRLQSMAANYLPLFKLVSPLNTRVFGNVLFSPALAKHGCERLSDWALISLHQERHDSPLLNLQNEVYVEKIQEIDMQILEHFLSPYQLMSLQGKSLPLSGVVSERELQASQTNNVQGNPAMFVGKRGHKTSLTFGVANEIKSKVSRNPQGGIECTTDEWCIVGIGSAREAFSAPGDSGSCVWDLEGRICGMITSGLRKGQDNPADVTYYSTMEWLLQDMRRCSLDVSVM